MNNILCLGPFTSGKSAFLNMLLGVRILPEQLQSTNVPVVKIHAGKVAGLFIRESGQKYGNPIPSFAEVPADWSSFEHMELTVPGHRLLDNGLVLWDTPGINSTNRHHQEHLEEFLNVTIQYFQAVLFFVPGNLESCDLEFIKQWPDLRDKLKIVINIKQSMAERDCRRIESSVKKEVYLRLGNIPVELLYIGDVYEEFCEESEKNDDGYDDCQRIALWKKLVIDFEALRRRYEEKIIGDVVFEILNAKMDRPSIEFHREEPEAPKLPEDFKYIEGGTFLMGSPKDESGRSSDELQHLVSVSRFSMAKYDVTFDEYDAYCSATEATKPSDSGWGRGTRPVINVDWYDAVAYCNWRSTAELKKPCYGIRGKSISWDRSADGYRLPTEAEWEYAAKGGPGAISLELSEVYAGSANLDQVAWYSGNSGKQPHPVGEKTPNSLVLYDMAGNVWQWCWDWYDAYNTDISSDPMGPASGVYRVLRGGSWNREAQRMRSANRSNCDPLDRGNGIGFRLVFSQISQ
jgi:formylglycine-generating enzyme required for sulfatase activity